VGTIYQEMLEGGTSSESKMLERGTSKILLGGEKYSKAEIIRKIILSQKFS